MTTPAIYDFDVISDKYKEILKEKGVVVEQPKTEPTQQQPTPQSDNQGEWCGGAWRNPYTQIDIESMDWAEHYKAKGKPYRPGTPPTALVSPPYRILPGV